MEKKKRFTLRGLRSHKRFCRMVASASSFLTLVPMSVPAFAAGTDVLGGDSVLSGATGANLAQNTDAYAQFVSSGGSTAVLDWTKFNVGAGKEMNFDGSGTTFFNLVDGAASKSQIDGLVSGNGSVWVINPNGIAFGAGAQVNVGGLFAAAAASVENADDLRGGIAELPVLGKMSGRIDIGTEEESSHFSSERSLFLANRVQVNNADFSKVNRTTVEGVGYVTLEKIEGGLINIRPSDFRSDDTGVILGDVQAGGLFQVMANGDVTINGDVSVEGNAVFKTADGDITVAKDASISINGNSCGMEMSAGHLSDDYLERLELDEDGKSGVIGNVNIHGKVSFSSDVGGFYIRAGEGVGSEGNLILDGDVSILGNDNWVDLRSGYGYSSSGGFDLSGSLSIEGDGNTGVLIAGSGDYSTGDLNVSGDVTVLGNSNILELDTANGYCAKGRAELSGLIRLDGSSSQLAMFAGAGAMSEGHVNITTDADIIAHGRENIVRVMTGYGDGSSGTLHLQGSILVDEGSRMVSYSGYGTESKGGISVSGTVTVEGDGGFVGIYAGSGDGSEGSVVVENGGSIVASGKNGTINVIAANGNNSAGNVKISGTMEVNGENGDVGVWSAYGAETEGDISIDGSVTAEGDDGFVGIYVGCGDGSKGSLVVENGGSVVANGKGGRIEVAAAHGDNSAGDAKISGTVEANGEDGEAYVWSAYGENATGDLVINGVLAANGLNGFAVAQSGHNACSNGDVEISETGHVSADGKNGHAQVESGVGDNANGNINVAGRVTANGIDGNVYVGAGEGSRASGDINISGSIAADGIRGHTQILAAVGDGASGNVNISGNISADGYRGDSVGDSETAQVSVLVGVANGVESLGNVSVTGEIHANGDNGSVSVCAGNGYGSIGVIDNAGVISANGNRGYVEMTAAFGNAASGSIVLSGAVTADGKDGNAKLFAGYGDDSFGNVCVERSGLISANGAGAGVLVVAGHGKNANCDVAMNGAMLSKGEDGTAVIIAGYGEGANGDVGVGGEISTCVETQIRTADGSVRVSGALVAEGESGRVAVWAAGSDKDSGNVIFTDGGNMKAVKSATIVATGDVTQEYLASLTSVGGYVSTVSLPATIAAKDIYLKTGGDVGSSGAPVAVDGAVHGVVGGDAALAVAKGGNFKGGDAESAPTALKISSVQASIESVDPQGEARSDKVAISDLSEDFSALGGSASLLVEGGLSIYTAGKLEANGLLKAGGDLTISAASFGDVSYLRAGGSLTINNVGKPAYPQVAYFESINGVEPQINNQPNDTVIFVDGRLAGGNLKILNQFGANEAFMVSTPELKSTQGIFGNPPFLHSDLDVANPMEVSAIDYMLQETPRLTLDKDFPPEVDSHVDSVVVPEKDSIQFGREAENEDAADEPRVETASTSSSFEGKIAMLR